MPLMHAGDGAKCSTLVATTTTQGYDCSPSVATPKTLLTREQMQSHRHAPHRLGPPDEVAEHVQHDDPRKRERDEEQTFVYLSQNNVT